MLRFRLFISAIGLALSLSAGPLLAQSFQEPGSQPPGGVVAPPLNGSQSIQRKAGHLLIGPSGGSAALCLNPDTGNPSLVPADNTDCISSWSGIVNPLGGPFVRLQGNWIGGDPFRASSYVLQPGFSRIRATNPNHAFSLLSKAPDICLEEDGLPCAWGTGRGNCRCTNSGDGCRANYECADPLTGRPTSTTGIFASDGGNTANTAGLFEGRVYVHGWGTGGTGGEICLNGTDASSCIASWDEVASPGVVSYVKLQATPPTETQVGAALVSGVGDLGSIIAGDPSGLPINITCGDGICTPPSETAGTCPVDCATVNPLASFGGSTVYQEIQLIGITSPQSPTGNVRALIVKSEGSAPTLVPQTGSSYFTNQVYGNSTIYYSASVPQNATFGIANDVDVTSGQTYYYNAYQGNLFPRWSSVRQWSATLRQLTLIKTGATIKSYIWGPGFVCDLACTNIMVFVQEGTTVSLYASNSSGYRTNFSGPCTGQSCTYTVTGDATVNANVVYVGVPPSTGGGGRGRFPGGGGSGGG